jgi:hypothetical protein
MFENGDVTAGAGAGGFAVPKTSRADTAAPQSSNDTSTPYRMCFIAVGLIRYTLYTY